MKRTSYAVLLLVAAVGTVLPLVGLVMSFVMIYAGVTGDAYYLPMRLSAANPLAMLGALALPLQLAVVALIVRRLWLSVEARRFAVPASVRGFAYAMSAVVMISVLLGILAFGLTMLVCRAGSCSGVPAGLVLAIGYLLAPFVFLYCEIRSILDDRRPDAAVGPA